MANFKNIAFNVVLLGFIINSVAFGFAESGVAEDWGIDPDPGGTSAIQDVRDSAETINPADGISETLFAAFTTVAKVGNAVLTFMFVFPEMIDNLPGVPTWVATMIGFPFTLLWFGAMVYLIAGRRV